MLEIAVGDCGDGIPVTLGRNPALARRFSNDHEAIVLAIEDGVSCLDDPYRGYGLGYVRHEVTSATKRMLTIRSHSGYAIVYGSGHLYHDSCAYFQGTLAHAVIPCG